MKKLLTFKIFWFLSLVLSAQDVKVTAEYPSVVSMGQQFMVSYTVNAGGGEFTIPSFTGFTKIMGPQTSYSESTEIINGKVSRLVTYSYIYYLMANKTGKYVIPQAVFTLKNKEYYSDPLNIEVVADPSGVQQSNNASVNEETSSTQSSDLFVNLAINRKEVFVGEPVYATVKIFTRVDLQGINEIKYPSFNDFLRTDIETPPLTSLKQEKINGSVFGTGVIQQFLLYPQKAGEITIEPVQLSVIVQQKTGSSDPFFGDFFSSYQSIPKTIASKPVTIAVKALPGNKPDDFSGVVGNLNMNASLSGDSVNVNDALTFKINISGTGNLKIASKPELKLAPDIEVYDPKVTDNLTNTTSGSSGSKQFEYILIPRHHGDFTIPPVTYSYFNTSTGKYETLKTKEFSFHSNKTDDQSNGITVYGGVSKEDVQYLGKDIRFIKSDSGSLQNAKKIFSASSAFYLMYALPLLIFFVILFLRREFVKRNSDSSAVRNRKAVKIAVKRLHAAALCLKNNELDKFHEEILKALWGYLSDKLNIPVSELTRANTISALSAKGIEDERINNLNKILDTCEYARFAPSASGIEAEKIYEDASQFIKLVENSIR
ncbi:MAG TPA: BatD family protein [Bacteroidales bacterium]|nr:BatD family protein [Bacteroidales bacterium]